MIRYAATAALILLAAVTFSRVAAQGNAPPKPDPATELGACLRSLLLLALPDPLYEDRSHWGMQKMVARRIRLKKKDGDLRFEVDKKPKNDGLWWQVRVTADRPQDTLRVEVRDLKQSEPGKMTFTMHVALDTDVDYDRQKWGEGMRLWGAGLRARLRIRMALRCEVAASFQNQGPLLPEVVFRLRVIGSEVGYDNVRVEHIAGLGGDGAKIIGSTFLDAMRQWRPSLERKLLEKANAAIVKAGDTKEIRLSLFGLMRK